MHPLLDLFYRCFMPTNKKVLLVEDSRDMQLTVSTAIGDDCKLTCVGSIADAEKALKSGNYSLLLLDVTLPDGDGFEFCKTLRAMPEYADLPIIFLTGHGQIEDKILGFELGADDYVTKPIEPEEFTARILGKLRRQKNAQTVINQAGYRIDLSKQKVFSTSDDGQERELSLTPIEFKLLTHFLQNEKKIFSRQDLLNLFWGNTVHVSGHTVDTHISSLRKKMGSSGILLHSVFRKGYCFGQSADDGKSEN